MIWAALAVVILVVCFGVVLLVGAPFLPTMKPQIQAALELAELKPGQTLLDLGSGDGRVLIAAAKQGINSVGYELNPIMVLIAWLRTIKYRKNVRIIWGDYWQKPWPKHQAIFTFLLPRLMPKLDKKVMQSKHKPVKLLSFAFAIPDKPIDREKDGVYLYFYK